MATDVRQDLFQTSTGVGHHFRPGYYFPSSNYKSVLLAPLPPKLVRNPPEITHTEQYKTTTGTVHDFKQISNHYGNRDPLYKKAPGHWHVDYNKDLHEKLQPGGWKLPLTMGFQTSEAHAQYRAQPQGIGTATEFVPNPQGFLLEGHMQGGASQSVLPNSHNTSLAGRVFYPKDKAVMDLNDPYLTTTNKYHRRFTPKELDSYPLKNVATYWECEEYPKAWGHGMKHNPLPKDAVPREQLPMRDTMIFKSATKVRRPPPLNPAVPHSGLKSEYTAHYMTPSDARAKEAAYYPVDTPYTLPAPGVKATYTSPHMYKSEYTEIGSMRPLTV